MSHGWKKYRSNHWSHLIHSNRVTHGRYGVPNFRRSIPNCQSFLNCLSFLSYL
jgi:hypothetical protein